MFSLPNEALYCLRQLNDAGFEAFAVGGMVRDAILARNGSDIDLTTNALPAQIKAVFRDHSVIETGIKHGTVTVMLNAVPVEITTYRTESSYSDGRHPDDVRFTRHLTDDLARRDFTINSMAYHPSVGLVDPFGGREDLQNGVLRCVGVPEERFFEDALRILRLLRFASVLGFSIEAETAVAAAQLKERLLLLSKERIAAEMKKLLCGKQVRTVLCNYAEILSIVFPFLKKMQGFDQRNFHHCYDILEHTAVVTASIAPRVHLRLAAFFHDCGKPDCFSLDNNGVGHFYAHASRSAAIAKDTLETLKLDRKTIERVVNLVKLHDAPIEADVRIIKRKLNKYGEDVLLDLIELQRADTLGLAPEFHSRLPHFDTLETMIKTVVDENAAFSVRSLAVNGNDMLALGLHGKEIGKTLQALTDAVIDEKVKNETAALLHYCKKEIIGKS